MSWPRALLSPLHQAQPSPSLHCSAYQASGAQDTKGHTLPKPCPAPDTQVPSTLSSPSLLEPPGWGSAPSPTWTTTGSSQLLSVPEFPTAWSAPIWTGSPKMQTQQAPCSSPPAFQSTQNTGQLTPSLEELRPTPHAVPREESPSPSAHVLDLPRPLRDAPAFPITHLVPDSRPSPRARATA